MAIMLALCSPFTTAATAAPVRSGAPLLTEIHQARDLVCELQATSRPRNAPSRLMLIIENVQSRSNEARLLTSAASGARPVSVYAGETGVHFVEDVEASVKVTTLLSCLRWKERADSRQCIRYEAVNRWHFDTTVHRNPDQSYLRLAENSYAGWCEPWRME